MSILPDRPTFFHHRMLPEAEQTYAKAAYENMCGMDQRVIALAHSVELHLWAMDKASQIDGRNKADRPLLDRLYSWARIGASAGALEIYSFYELTKQFNNHCAKCPTLVEMTDRKGLKAAWKAFDASFPGFADVRLGAAHPGELNNTPAKKESNYSPSGFESQSVKSAPGAKLIFDGAIVDGKHSSYKCDQSAVLALVSVSNKVWEVMAPAMKQLWQLNMEKHGAPRRKPTVG